MKRVLEIEGRVTWRYFRGASGALVGICDQLGLTIQGDTFAELAETAEEAMELLLGDLLKTNQFAAFLARQGWRMVSPMPAKGRASNFRIPMDLVNVGRPQYHDSQALAGV